MYEKEYFVHVYDTGPDGHLSLFAFFNYLQDIASEHANKMGFGRDDLMKGNWIWVLSRIYAEFTHWPVWEDRLRVKTWHRGTDRLFGLRDFIITRDDGAAIAAATSSWAVIDVNTRKIQRPDAILAESFAGGLAQNALPRNAGKVEPAAADGSVSATHKVRISDIDINLHTNNAKYLQWATDSYNLDFVMTHQPRSVELNFLAESKIGDEIHIRTSRDPQNHLHMTHSILRSSDAGELCRVRIEWGA